MLNPDYIKRDFPILQQKVHGQPLVYLDNAATSQKPTQVIEAISDYYKTANANVHRGVHALSDASTNAWEQARQTISGFFGAKTDELVVTRNTTEAMNGIAYGWGQHNLQQGDVILSTVLEHHSSLVVWQQLAQQVGAHLELIEIDEVGRIKQDHLQQLLEKYQQRIRLISFVHVSNTLGVVQPVTKIVELVREAAKKWPLPPRVVIDSAQSAPHLKLDFAQLDVDFLVFSGHKMLGPMGFGGLLVKQEVLANEMKPWLFGGGMIDSVAVQETLFHPELSERFTAGTPDVASAVGMAAACEYLQKLGMPAVTEHDRGLVEYALEQLQTVTEVELIGPVSVGSSQQRLDRIGSVAFVYKGVHAHDVAQILDSQGIAVRSGHHCTMPLHQHFKWQATVRASFQIYNTNSDIDALVNGLAKVKQVFLPGA